MRGTRGWRPETETFEVARVAIENRRRLGAGVRGATGQEIQGAQATSHLGIAGVELFGLQEERKGEAELAHLVVRDAGTCDRVPVGGLQAERVHVLDDRLRELLAVE